LNTAAVPGRGEVEANCLYFVPGEVPLGKPEHSIPDPSCSQRGGDGMKREERKKERKGVRGGKNKGKKESRGDLPTPTKRK